MAGTCSEGRCMGSSGMVGKARVLSLLLCPRANQGQPVSGAFRGQEGGQGGVSSACSKDD